MATILFEACNLTLPEGSGIKTYASNLGRNAISLGYQAQVLLSSERSLSRKDPLLAEVTFFEAPKKTKKKMLPLSHYIHNATHFITGSPFGIGVTELSSSGTVIDPFAQAGSRSTFNTVYAAHRLPIAALHHFQRYGERVMVRLPTLPDLFHATQPITARVAKIPNIYTIHDIVPLRLPYATLDNKRYFLNAIRYLCRHADHIVTVSEHSRRDIIELTNISEDRITNTYQAVHVPEHLLALSETEVAAFIENAFGLEMKSYYLFFGALEPKKNVDGLIDAFAASGVPHPLVVTGGTGWSNENTISRMQQEQFLSYRIANDRISSERKIRWLKYQPFSTLVTLIRGAKAVLFPSFYEGFGLPVLESMLLGTPVLTSNLSSLPEVAGDAALLVDPHDIAMMSKAIRQMDGDADLRTELSARGLRQAAKFSPEAHNEKIATVYRRFI